MRKSGRVLITGGAGYVGSVLIPTLLDSGFAVRVLDKFYFGSDSLDKYKDKIEVVKGDICDVTGEIFEDVYSVIHLAGFSNDPTSNFNPKANRKINTQASIRLGKLAKKRGVQRFVLASSCSIYDKEVNNDVELSTELTPVFPKAHYSKSKRDAEKGLLKIADNNFCVTILRKGTIHGVSPRMRYDLVLNTMIKTAFSENKLRVFCRGVQWRPIIDVKDVAQAYLQVINKPTRMVNKEIINIVGNNLQIKDLALQIQEFFKVSLKKSIGISFEQDEKIDRSYKVSGEKAKSLLNFFPRVSIKKSIKTIAEEINNGHFNNFNNPKYYNIRWMKPILIRENL